MHTPTAHASKYPSFMNPVDVSTLKINMDMLDRINQTKDDINKSNLELPGIHPSDQLSKGPK